MDTKEEILLGILNSTYICTNDGYAYFLGPEADKKMAWEKAIDWCKNLGDNYELPDNTCLSACYKNEELRKQFKLDWYWSSIEFNSTGSWLQDFFAGSQYSNYKGNYGNVRAVRKVKI